MNETTTIVPGLELSIPKQSGFVRIVSEPQWTLASLGYSEKHAEGNFEGLARHLLTDEAFILLEGSATLVIGRELRKVEMKPFAYYTVKAGTWHHILLKPDSRVAVVENSGTSKDNTETLLLK